MVDKLHEFLNNPTDLTEAVSVQALSRYASKEGNDRETISALSQLNKENFWENLPKILNPVFQRPGLKNPEKKKYYNSVQILSSQSYCVVDTALKTLVKCKDLLKVVYEKPYKFDPLVSKLVDTVAMLFLAHDIKVLFSNTFAVSHVAGYVEGNRIVAMDKYVVVNINPSLSLMKTNVNGNTISGLDDVYRNVFTTFAKIIHTLNSYSFDAKKYSDASGFVFSNLVLDNKDGQYGWFDFLRTKHDQGKMCKVLAEQSLSVDDFRADPDSIYIKRCFINACQRGESKDVYADVYGLIVDGLETDRGVKHQKLAYLQPMVSFIKDHFEPSHIQYRNDLCSKNTVVECYDFKDAFMLSMRYVGEVEESLVRGTLIGD